MGGTIILWEALRTGQISLYPEYTGTIAEENQDSRKAEKEMGAAKMWEPPKCGDALAGDKSTTCRGAKAPCTFLIAAVANSFHVNVRLRCALMNSVTKSS